MFRFRQLMTRFARPRMQLPQNTHCKPPARAMTSGGQARLTGPVGPISLALLVIGGGSSYWYVTKCSIESCSFIMQTQVLFAKRERAAAGNVMILLGFEFQLHTCSLG
jgi:hypothetical protein